jgi:hypothetical protein
MSSQTTSGVLSSAILFPAQEKRTALIASRISAQALLCQMDDFRFWNKFRFKANHSSL